MGTNRPRRRTVRHRALRAALCAVLTLRVVPALSPAFGLETKDKGHARELQKVEQDLRVSEARAAELRRAVEALKQDRAKLNQALLDAGARIQTLEGEIGAGEARIRQLTENEAGLRGSLESRRAMLAELLAAMQRVGANPPPALLVRPEDALGSVRAALLLGAALPELRAQAEALTSDLKALAAVRDRIRTEQDALRRDLAGLAEEHERLSLLLAQKKAAEAHSEQEFDAARRQAETLAASARTLKDLIGRAETEIPSSRQAAGEAELASREAERRHDPKAALASLGDAARLKPAVPFAAAHGLLPLPASGVRLRGYGDRDGFGGVAKGVSIATRSGAQVTSPADGWVVYAGPFRSYGQLLIINAGGGYHVLLAGMEKINVELGRFVLAGEPVAAMGGRSAALASPESPGTGQPVLYVEFRKDGAAIDPSPWWAGRNDEKVRG